MCSYTFTSKIIFFSFFLVIICFPIFFTLTIYGTKVDAYSCKVNHLISYQCLDDIGDVSYIFALYDVTMTNNSQRFATYKCPSTKKYNCISDDCLSHIEPGGFYICYYTYITKGWKLSLSAYHYDSTFPFFLMLTLTLSLVIIFVIIVAIIVIIQYCKYRDLGEVNIFARQFIMMVSERCCNNTLDIKTEEDNLL